MDPIFLKQWLDVIQGALTIVSIIIAGIWGFFVFILGRSYAPNILVKITQQEPSTQVGPILQIQVKNIGKTSVRKERCTLICTEISLPPGSNPEQQLFQRLDPSLKEMAAELPMQYHLFNDHQTLEPDEELEEDVLIEVPKGCIFKALVMFTAQKRRFGQQPYWIGSAVFDTVRSTLQSRAESMGIEAPRS